MEREQVATIECLKCGKRSMIAGATVGRVELTIEQVQEARQDMAKSWVREGGLKNS